MATKRLLVDPPSMFTASPFGLLSVVSWPAEQGPHWQNGIEYRIACLNEGDTTYDVCTAVSGTAAPPSKTATTSGFDVRGATPFTVRTEFDCAPIGLGDAQAIAEQKLAQTESYQVEYTFHTGTVASTADVAYPHLAADTEVTDPEDADVLLQSMPTTGTAADVACALGFIEENLGDCYNGQGVIHVPARAFPTLVAWDLVEPDGDRLRTRRGHLVAVGNGYPATGPAGDAVTQCQAWFYGTGPVWGYRSAVSIRTLRDSMDRSKNSIKMHAERTYLLTWGCCHAAVQATLGVPTP